MSLDWSPEYPTEAAQTYLRGFLAGCEMEQLTGIPDALLSRLIDIAIGHQWAALDAGRLFGKLWWRISKRREWRQGSIWNADAYLFGAYEKELENLKKLSTSVI